MHSCDKSLAVWIRHVLGHLQPLQPLPGVTVSNPVQHGRGMQWVLKGVTHMPVIQDALVWRVVNDDDAGSPARGHIGLQCCPQKIVIPAVPFCKAHSYMSVSVLPSSIGRAGVETL